MKSFEIVTTFRYKERVTKLFDIKIVMVLVSVSIHETRVSSTFLKWFKILKQTNFQRVLL